MQLASLVLAGVGLVFWGLQLITLLRVARRVPLLHTLPEVAQDHWPRVSAILTARNEEAALEGAVRARFAEDYPNLELILVDDRSTDRTPEIADRLAAADPRVRVVHVETLPAGWLGKLNALQQGLEVATGEWVLFSDADVSVHRGVLRRLLAHCEAKQIDHCVLMPRLRPVNPVLDCVTSIFLRFVALNFRIWAIEDPHSSASVGVGAFNLVRRSALDRTPGLAWLKMEVADDIALGQMLKASGARQTVVNGRALADLVFHRSIADSLISAERATYTAIGNFSLLRLTLLGTVALVLELSPLLALALARDPASLVAAVGLFAVALAAQVVSNRWHARSSWNLVFFPFAELVVFFSQVRSGVLGTLRGGIRWRGTFYANADLKAGRRFGTSWHALRDRRDRR
jgi:glycosyltransferase involved in cell wall biosynthesis